MSASHPPNSGPWTVDMRPDGHAEPAPAAIAGVYPPPPLYRNGAGLPRGYLRMPFWWRPPAIPELIEPIQPPYYDRLLPIRPPLEGHLPHITLHLNERIARAPTAHAPEPRPLAQVASPRPQRVSLLLPAHGGQLADPGPHPDGRRSESQARPLAMIVQSQLPYEQSHQGRPTSTTPLRSSSIIVGRPDQAARPRDCLALPVQMIMERTPSRNSQEGETGVPEEGAIIDDFMNHTQHEHEDERNPVATGFYVEHDAPVDVSPRPRRTHCCQLCTRGCISCWSCVGEVASELRDPRFWCRLACSAGATFVQTHVRR